MNTQKPFVYGVSVTGDLFTDRELESQRLKLNFEHGINSVLISPRRMGKTSLVKHVAEIVDPIQVKVVYMDAYKCRDAYEFYELFASSIIKATSSKADQMIETAKEFIMSIAPAIHYSPEPTSDFSLSLGINRRNNPPEEILQLPERIAQKRGYRIVVCIDEFQQIGEFPDSLTTQKEMRSVWQHQQLTSYCFFGSKKHLMTNLFQSRSMPFYQFGDMFFLKKISTEKWVPFLQQRFSTAAKILPNALAESICQTADCYPSYVQQLAWNVLTVSQGQTVTEEDVKQGISLTIAQVIPLFVEQTQRLTAYQLNLLRAICTGYHDDFGKKEITSQYNLGVRSNLQKLLTALTDRELIDHDETGWHITDPLFQYWFRREMM